MSVLRAQVKAVIERVGATDMAADIIIDLVNAHRDEDDRAYERDKKRRSRTVPGQQLECPGTVFIPSDPGSSLSGSGSPDLSEPKERDRESDGRRALAVIKPPSAFVVAMEQFKAAWEARYGVAYVPTSSDRNQLGRLIVKFTAAQRAELPRCFAGYLNDLDPFVAQQRRHDLTWFCTGGNGFNKYRTAAPILSRGEAQTIAAGEQWEAMRNGKG